MIDVAIVGGGISGLWLLNRLRDFDYDAHLFENRALGYGQTIASQGIIHGGMKYALGGAKEAPASALEGMPKRWGDCLAGCGEIDLRAVRVLSEKHELRAGNRLLDIPLWAFPEPVLDVKSLLSVLACNAAGCVHLGGRVEARATIYTAGAGNETICWPKGWATQRRPLRMFMVGPMKERVYAHYVEASTKPRVTITSHEGVWYLGGNIAEKAVGMDDFHALRWAWSEMGAIMPGTDWKSKQWAIHDIDRSEPAGGLVLPDRPKILAEGNQAVAWPSKLALAPILADELVTWLASIKVYPSGEKTTLDMPTPRVALLPWECAKWL